jgi:hypothetical protein
VVVTSGLETRATTLWCVGYGAYQDHNAEGRHPQTPAAATDEPGKIENRKARERRRHDVTLIEQIENADDQADESEPARQRSSAEDDDAQGDGPGDAQQLPEVLAKECAAVLMLGEPGRRDRSAVCGIALLLHPRQRRHDENPAQETDQGQQCRDRASECGNP